MKPVMGFLSDDTSKPESEDVEAQNLEAALKKRRQKLALDKGIPPEPEPEK